MGAPLRAEGPRGPKKRARSALERSNFLRSSEPFFWWGGEGRDTDDDGDVVVVVAAAAVVVAVAVVTVVVVALRAEGTVADTIRDISRDEENMRNIVNGFLLRLLTSPIFPPSLARADSWSI